MYDLYGALIGNLSNYLYTYILIILLVAGGIYFTVRTKFVQFRYLKESLRVVLAQQSVSADSDHYSGCGSQRFWECLLLSWRELWLRSISAVPMTAAATAVRPTTSIRQPENTGSESCLQCS